MVPRTSHDYTNANRCSLLKRVYLNSHITEMNCVVFFSAYRAVQEDVSSSVLDSKYTETPFMHLWNAKIAFMQSDLSFAVFQQLFITHTTVLV